MPKAIETIPLSLRSSAPEVALAASLTRPNNERAQGIVVLLTGSGPQDRDETIAGQKPFLHLREALAQQGFAAVSWDDRGVGESGGDYFSITSDNLVADVAGVVEQLHQDHPQLPIILAGHSQGVLIASQTAAAFPDRINALALLAGSGRPGREQLIEQHRTITQAEGWNEAAIEATLNMKRNCFDQLMAYPQVITESQHDELHAKLLETVQHHYQSWQADLDQHADEIRLTVDDLMEWEWRYLLHSQPAEVLSQVRCPVFAAAGALDTQINPTVDLEAMNSVLRPGQCTTLLVPTLNHLFQRAETGGLDEYEHAGPPFDPSITIQLIEWLRQLPYKC